MADREKVIDHLMIIRTWNEVGKAYAYDEMDKKEKTKTVEWIDDALELLKEQRAIKPIYDEKKYGDHLPHCGDCEKVLPNNAVYGKVNFCHYCGQAVK